MSQGPPLAPRGAARLAALDHPRDPRALGPGRAGPSNRRGGRWIALLLVLLQCLSSVPAAQGAADEDPLAALKVAFVYNFTRFVQWPQAPASRPFVIGVIGDPVLEGQLRVLEREAKRVEGRPIQIRAYLGPEAIAPSEILFVGARVRGELEAILRRTAGWPTLLVGDGPGDAARGLAIELFRKPDIFGKTERLGLRINPSGIKDRGLKVSAQLYDVAEVVR